MIKRKIIAVTGARSEYDLLSPVYEMLHRDEAFDFGLIVTGAHLSERYGMSVRLIEKDGFPIFGRIDNLEDSNERIGRIISLGRQIPALAENFDRLKPDMVLVAGDREEAITVTMTAAYMGIASAHFFGGDIAKDGNIDNSTRYAASKYASAHFPVLEQHKNTLLKLGEDEWRIFVVGNPALDKYFTIPIKSRKEISEILNFNVTVDKFLVMIQHPVIDEVEMQAELITETLDAIVQSGYKCLINYPNSDAGNFPIIDAINKYAKENDNLFLFKNLARDVYINLMRHASCIVGNSSSGIIEAPSLGLPAVNVGKRQRGRIFCENVIFVENDCQQILDAIKKSVEDEGYRKIVKEAKNPYGDGNSSKRIVDILKRIEINDKLIYKNITY